MYPGVKKQGGNFGEIQLGALKIKKRLNWILKPGSLEEFSHKIFVPVKDIAWALQRFVTQVLPSMDLTPCLELLKVPLTYFIIP